MKKCLKWKTGCTCLEKFGDEEEHEAPQDLHDQNVGGVKVVCRLASGGDGVEGL